MIHFLNKKFIENPNDAHHPIWNALTFGLGIYTLPMKTERRTASNDLIQLRSSRFHFCFFIFA